MPMRNDMGKVGRWFNQCERIPEQPSMGTQMGIRQPEHGSPERTKFLANATALLKQGNLQSTSLMTPRFTYHRCSSQKSYGLLWNNMIFPYDFPPSKNS